MQKSIRILGDILVDETNTKEFIKRSVPPILPPKFQENQIDKRWQEIKITGENLKNRSHHAICQHGDFLYSYGGYEENQHISSTFARMKIQNFNDTYKWEMITPKSYFNPGTRRRHSLLCYKDKIYLFGGQTTHWQSAKLNEVYEYDIQLNEWNIKKNDDLTIQIPILDSHNAFLYDDEMYIFGGYSPKQYGFSNAMYAFNLQNYTWRIININQCSLFLIPKRAGASLSLFKDNIYVFGGQNETDRLNDIWCLNLLQTKQSNKVQWEQLDPDGCIPQIRNGHQSIIYKTYLFVFGGIHNQTKELNDIQAYDIIENRWVQVHTDSNMLYVSSPAFKNKKKLLEFSQRSDSRDSIRNSLKRADSLTPGKYTKSASMKMNKQSKFKRQNTLNDDILRNESVLSIQQEKEIKNFSSHNLNQSLTKEMSISGKYLQEKRQKEFREKKLCFLSSIDVSLAPVVVPNKKETKINNKDQIKSSLPTYSRSDSPITIAIKSSLRKIGNQNGRYLRNNSSFIETPLLRDTPQLKNASFMLNTPQKNDYMDTPLIRDILLKDTPQSIKYNKNMNRSFTSHLLDTLLPPIVFEKGKNIVIGKKPCARDGHVCYLIRENQLLIFGGDRHNMSFNDIYLFDLDKAINKHIMN